jgi:Fic family protein
MRKLEAPPITADLFRKSPQEIAKIMQSQDFQTIMGKCETAYWPWDMLRFRVRNSEIEPEAIWIFSQMSRKSRMKTLPLLGYGGTALRFNMPDALQHELMLIDQQLAGGIISNEDSLPPASQRERFIVSALQEEAIASSMLEGAVTTHQEAKEMLKAGRKPRDRGEQMVVNNYHAIQFIRENRNTELSPNFLLELQKILTDRTLDDTGQVGRFRTTNDLISVVDARDNEVMHIPPPASELPVRLKALCDFANQPPQEKKFVHPVVAACVLHFQVGFDHPFCDGNGRTARALFYWMMLHHGYWLFEYLPISRLIYRAPIKYARAFLYCENDSFDVTYFLLYKAKIIGMARRDLREYISKKQQHLAQARRLSASDSRLNHRQQELVLNATRNPDRYFTISEHRGKYAISYQTARNDFLELAKWKYFKKRLIGKRFEFVAGEKISEIGQD